VSPHLRRSVVVISFAILAGLYPVGPGLAQTKSEPQTPQFGGTYRRPLSNNPSILDPALIADTYGFTVAQQLFDGLVQYDGSLTITPAIAQSWKGSRDGLSWVFQLRKGVKFHNGREVTADDVVYSFTRILDPKTNSKAAEMFLKIKGAKEFVEGRAKTIQGLRATDRYTIQIELTEASAPFVANLAIGYAKIIPREAIETLGPAFGNRPVGTGPFKFSHWKKDEEIVLEVNRDYYGGRPYLDRLEYKIFPGQQTDAMLRQFELGGLEDTFIPSTEIDRFQKDSKYQFVRRPTLGVRFLGFNTTHGPLANRLVRQAFILAVDRDSLARDINKNRFKAAQGILPPGTYGYDPQFRPYPYDPEHAKALLTKAGYPDGKGLPVFQIWSSVKSVDVEREHEAIRRYLADVGIRVEFQYNTNWPSFNSQVYEGKYPIFRYGWVADVPEPDNFLYRIFYSQSRNNLPRFRNERVDHLLDQARAEQVYSRRIALYREAEQAILGEVPVLPLSFYGYERLFQPYVKSVEVSALGDPYIPMRKIWLAK